MKNLTFLKHLLYLNLYHKRAFHYDMNMNPLFQLTLLIFIYISGEFTSQLIPTPLPGNVIGFIYLFIILKSGILKVSKIENVSNFFLKNLAILFIPGGVGLIKVSHLFDGNLLKIGLIILISTTLTILATSGTIILLERLKK